MSYDAWCGWHNKPLEYVTEIESASCSDEGWTCEECPYYAEHCEPLD